MIPTCEARKFSKEKSYKHKSIEIDGILYYSEKVLPSEVIGFSKSLSNTSFDLASSTFCVSMVYSFSLKAYSFVDDTHWNSKMLSI